MTTHIDADTFLAALSFSLELNAVPILVNPTDGTIYVAPFGKTFNSYKG